MKEFITLNVIYYIYVNNKKLAFHLGRVISAIKEVHHINNVIFHSIHDFKFSFDQPSMSLLELGEVGFILTFVGTFGQGPGNSINVSLISATLVLGISSSSR